jgi:hypothetical protein
LGDWVIVPQKKLINKIMKPKFEWERPFIIGYAPNTTYICKSEGIVVMNVDNQNVDWYIGDFELSEGSIITREKLLAVLN